MADRGITGRRSLADALKQTTLCGLTIAGVLWFRRGMKKTTPHPRISCRRRLFSWQTPLIVSSLHAHRKHKQALLNETPWEWRSARLSCSEKYPLQNVLLCLWKHLFPKLHFNGKQPWNLPPAWWEERLTLILSFCLHYFFSHQFAHPFFRLIFPFAQPPPTPLLYCSPWRAERIPSSWLLRG